MTDTESADPLAPWEATASAPGRSLSAPPVCGVDAIDDLVAEHAKLLADFKRLGVELRELRESRPRAEADDTAALAAALRSGAKDPGPKHVTALNAQLAAVQRTRDATGQALRSIEKEYGAARVEHRGVLVETAEEQRADARAAWSEAVDVLERCWDDLGAAEGAHRWAANPRARFNDQPPVAADMPVAVLVTELRDLADR